MPAGLEESAARVEADVDAAEAKLSGRRLAGDVGRPGGAAVVEAARTGLEEADPAVCADAAAGRAAFEAVGAMPTLPPLELASDGVAPLAALEFDSGVDDGLLTPFAVPGVELAAGAVDFPEDVLAGTLTDPARSLDAVAGEVAAGPLLRGPFLLKLSDRLKLSFAPVGVWRVADPFSCVEEAAAAGAGDRAAVLRADVPPAEFRTDPGRAAAAVAAEGAPAAPEEREAAGESTVLGMDASTARADAALLATDEAGCLFAALVPVIATGAGSVELLRLPEAGLADIVFQGSFLDGGAIENREGGAAWA